MAELLVLRPNNRSISMLRRDYFDRKWKVVSISGGTCFPSRWARDWNSISWIALSVPGF